jgi:hypothetical protein
VEEENKHLRYLLMVEREQKIKLFNQVDDLQKQVNFYKSRFRAEEDKKATLEHGPSRYGYGCRCQICKNAAADYQAEYRRKRAEARGE